MIVGILGGGQLGRMLALAGYPLGLRFRFLDPSPDAPVGDVGDLLVGRYEDEVALAGFVRGLDVVTYEFENVPAPTARFLADRVPVFPPPEALRVAQDRLAEKALFTDLGIPTPASAAADSPADLSAAVEYVGLPAIAKTRRFGYDGKGQRRLADPADVASVWADLGAVPLILEREVHFERELSLLAVRGRDGDTRCYPLVENQHRYGILRTSVAPAPNHDTQLQHRAEEYAARLLAALDYVGVLAVELFQVDGELLANEIAPRVHNTGHWTIEGAETSQFENHLRAILGWPLGSTQAFGHSAMVNLIGTLPDPAGVLAQPGTHLHRYGKAPRPGRKLGHITMTADTRDELERRLARLEHLACL